MEDNQSAVHARGLSKQYGDLWALKGLDLDVAPGTILGLLGHNGAGKTTAIKILTTLSTPTEGTATVAGIDVAKHPDEVRRRIGVTAQSATVDGLLSARKNLVMVGRLHHMSKPEATKRADALLEQFLLADASDRLAKNLSGGMRRRLDLAASLIATPQVLFLDEPTTGLDPRSRNDLWDVLRGLVREGCTIVLTTQYLEEADRLADDVVVLDHGRTVAHGTPDILKSKIGNDRVDVKVTRPDDLELVEKVAEPFSSGPTTFDRDLLTATVPVQPGTKLVDVLHALDDADVDVVDVNRRQATLDDVFLALTDPNPPKATEVAP